jgi:hypothetical protein
VTGDELLQHAAAIVRDRRRLYGDPSELFDQLAVRWSQVLACKVTPAQVGLCLRDLKLARLVHDPAHLDSIVDIAGYAACVGEITR